MLVIISDHIVFVHCMFVAWCVPVFFQQTFNMNVVNTDISNQNIEVKQQAEITSVVYNYLIKETWSDYLNHISAE